MTHPHPYRGTRRPFSDQEPDFGDSGYMPTVTQEWSPTPGCKFCGQPGHGYVDCPARPV